MKILLPPLVFLLSTISMLFISSVLDMRTLLYPNNTDARVFLQARADAPIEPTLASLDSFARDHHSHIYQYRYKDNQKENHFVLVFGEYDAKKSAQFSTIQPTNPIPKLAYQRGKYEDKSIDSNYILIKEKEIPIPDLKSWCDQHDLNIISIDKFDIYTLIIQSIYFPAIILMIIAAIITYNQFIFNKREYILILQANGNTLLEIYKKTFAHIIILTELSILTSCILFFTFRNVITAPLHHEVSFIPGAAPAAMAMLLPVMPFYYVYRFTRRNIGKNARRNLAIASLITIQCVFTTTILLNYINIRSINHSIHDANAVARQFKDNPAYFLKTTFHPKYIETNKPLTDEINALLNDQDSHGNLLFHDYSIHDSETETYSLFMTNSEFMQLVKLYPTMLDLVRVEHMKKDVYNSINKILNLLTREDYRHVPKIYKLNSSVGNFAINIDIITTFELNESTYILIIDHPQRVFSNEWHLNHTLHSTQFSFKHMVDLSTYPNINRFTNHIVSNYHQSMDFYNTSIHEKRATYAQFTLSIATAFIAIFILILALVTTHISIYYVHFLEGISALRITIYYIGFVLPSAFFSYLLTSIIIRYTVHFNQPILTKTILLTLVLYLFVFFIYYHIAYLKTRHTILRI